MLGRWLPLRKLYVFILFLLTDFLFSLASLYFALLLRFDGIPPERFTYDLRLYLPFCVFILVSALFGCYKGVWQYTGLFELFRQSAAVMASMILLFFMKYTGAYDIPGSVIIIAGGLFFIFSAASRLFPRVIQRVRGKLGILRKGYDRALIVGAGESGAMLIKYLNDNSRDRICPVGCIDDDPGKRDLRICGVRVLGTTDEITSAVQKCRANQIIISIPSADTRTIRSIYEKCLPCGMPIKLFQSVVDAQEYLKGKRSALREVSPEELLFRDSVSCCIHEEEYFYKKTVLVTGGAGSIGSELCRQALEKGCSKLIVFDICENALFSLNEELKTRYPQTSYEIVLGSVQDKERLNHVFSEYRPELVFHAAAHKHVPVVEINPFEAVKNNIVGTLNIVDACKIHHAEKFILISTDKAVNPTNIMGATKRIAELIVKTENCASTEMASVRFGNVLGSVGSVIPIFRKQIAAGGPVTITDLRMKRYFMTIPEAVSLVQAAAALANGGEIFVLDMGKPVRIYDLACDLIRLSGYEPNRDIDIVVTGLRPGEKLFEELSLDSESVDATSFKKIFIMRSAEVNRFRFYQNLSRILACSERKRDEEQLRALIFETVKDENQITESVDAAVSGAVLCR